MSFQTVLQGRGETVVSGALQRFSVVTRVVLFVSRLQKPPLQTSAQADRLGQGPGVPVSTAYTCICPVWPQ